MCSYLYVITTKYYSLCFTQIRRLHRRQAGRRQHRLAQRVGDPDRLVPVHAGRRPAESDRSAAPAAGHRQGRRHTVPPSVRRVVESRRTDARPHFDNLYLPGRYSLRLVRRILFHAIGSVRRRPRGVRIVRRLVAGAHSPLAAGPSVFVTICCVVVCAFRCTDTRCKNQPP